MENRTLLLEKKVEGLIKKECQHVWHKTYGIFAFIGRHCDKCGTQELYDPLTRTLWKV